MPLKRFLLPLKRYLQLGALLALLIASGTASFYKLRADSLKSDLALLERQLKGQRATVEALSAQRDKDLSALSSLQQELRASRATTQAVIDDLEGYRRNEAAVQADPDSVESVINTRLNRLFWELSCIGDTRADCSAASDEARASEATAP